MLLLLLLFPVSWVILNEEKFLLSEIVSNYVFAYNIWTAWWISSKQHVLKSSIWCRFNKSILEKISPRSRVITIRMFRSGGNSNSNNSLTNGAIFSNIGLLELHDTELCNTSCFEEFHHTILKLQAKQILTYIWFESWTFQIKLNEKRFSNQIKSNRPNLSFKWYQINLIRLGALKLYIEIHSSTSDFSLSTSS